MSDDELVRCQEEVRELKEENTHLRDAARTFGDLAERLRDRLKSEDEQTTDAQPATREVPKTNP